ncbi:MAG: DMT family transporter [Alphaproteobacteria bacterium]|nr:DMT family transporter [Alphaproteobacteria bacterium]MDX5368180.1 DMT family transporter [Alphaproteobacteria bacterium]MDX5462996.1 DMT family transporter [Alphaproteobacteria bacterium]
MKAASLTIIALCAFAANSVLARLALEAGEIDAFGYTGVRLASGAAMLGAILIVRRPARPRAPGSTYGTWRAAGALFGYAIAFSIAYLMLATGTGALILFATVQFGLLGWAVLKGERPAPAEWAGMALAFGSLLYLLSPGLEAPHPLGAALMIAAGLCWSVYTVLGQASRAPLSDTAGNFLRCLPVALVLAGAGAIAQAPSGRGLALAVASGAIASGLGYAIWYLVLPMLTRASAAFLQLTVPAIAAAGGIVFLGEILTERLAIASAGILGGVALALLAAERRRARMAART